MNHEKSPGKFLLGLGRGANVEWRLVGKKLIETVGREYASHPAIKLIGSRVIQFGFDPIRVLTELQVNLLE